MRSLMYLLTIITVGLYAQPKEVRETVKWTGQTKLDLAFDFADNITFELWDKKEVLVVVRVEIAEGKYNDIFSLSSKRSTSAIQIMMDKDMWDKIDRKDTGWRCSWNSTIDYTVYFPKELKVVANTISGSFEFEYFGQPLDLKTISGDIDITVPEKLGFDFYAETISGEAFSDLSIIFPYGKEGLRQIVGQTIKGRINEGGEESSFETVSGNIYLRKG